MEEAAISFVASAAIGVVVGIALGRDRMTL